MKRSVCLLLALPFALAATGCGTSSSSDGDAGKGHDSSAVGDGGAEDAWMQGDGSQLPETIKLVDEEGLLVGLTSDGKVIYKVLTDDQNPIYDYRAVPLAGGQVTQIVKSVNEFGSHTTVAGPLLVFWTNVVDDVGKLNVWNGSLHVASATDSIVGYIAASQDGTRLAYSAGAVGKNQSLIRVSQPDFTDAHDLGTFSFPAGGADATCKPKLAFMGERLVIAHCGMGQATGLVESWNLAGEAASKVVLAGQAGNHAFPLLRAAENGTRLILVDNSNTSGSTNQTYVAAPDGTAKHQLGANLDYNEIHLSPEGNKVVFIEGDKIHLGDMAQGAPAITDLATITEDDPIPAIIGISRDFQYFIYASNYYGEADGGSPVYFVAAGGSPIKLCDDALDQYCDTVSTLWYSSAGTTIADGYKDRIGRGFSADCQYLALLTNYATSTGTIESRPVTNPASTAVFSDASSFLPTIALETSVIYFALPAGAEDFGLYAADLSVGQPAHLIHSRVDDYIITADKTRVAYVVTGPSLERGIYSSATVY